MRQKPERPEPKRSLRMTLINRRDDLWPFTLGVAMDAYPGITKINKFGETINADDDVPTDLWDGSADAVSGGSAVWVPPNAARVHQITSTSVNDAVAGTGVQKMHVFGLTSWDSAETNEIVDMDGTNDSPTTNSYVIIHRMHGDQWGSGGVNAGVITATADTDNTITAAILTGANQTQMLVYGFPSNTKFQMCCLQAEIVKATGVTQRVDCELLYMKDPATYAATNTAWINKENFLVVEGQHAWVHDYFIPKTFDGPGIIKLQATSNAADVIVTGAFDAMIVSTT
jgi:hypothetical protein